MCGVCNLIAHPPTDLLVTKGRYGEEMPHQQQGILSPGLHKLRSLESTGALGPQAVELSCWPHQGLGGSDASVYEKGGVSCRTASVVRCAPHT